MSTFCHGVASAQSIDKSGEIVDIKGLDISSLASTGILNYEHKSDIPGQICGKILTAKKIFDKEDCSNAHEKYFWNKCKVPFVYITAELLDDYCQSGKDAAGILRYDHDKKDQNKYPILGFSIEGAEIPNSRGPNKMVVSRGIARKTTLTSAPCNLLCVAELLVDNSKSQIKDDFDEIFKSEEEAITLFKSGEGEKIYETYLAKKEAEPTIQKKEQKICTLHKTQLEKGEKPKWSEGKVAADGKAVHFSHPEHNIVSVHQPKPGEFHVKHNGRIAGVEGKKGVFNNMKDAGAHAQKFMSGLSNGTITAPAMQNHPSPETTIKKALTAGGSGNAAPSTLVNGAAYQTESMSKAKPSAEDHNFKGSKKKDWNARAKSDYQNWEHKEKFEKFMRDKMPHLSKGQIEAFGRVVALKKSIEFEVSLSNLVGLNKAEKPSGVTFHHESELPKGVKIGKEHRPSGDVGEHGENHRLNTTDNHYFAVHNNKVVGHVGIKDDSDEFHKPTINASYVNPEHRGKGVGMGLYQHVLSKEPSLASDNAREPGANAIWNKLKQQHPKNVTHDKKSDRFVWDKK